MLPPLEHWHLLPAVGAQGQLVPSSQPGQLRDHRHWEERVWGMVLVASGHQFIAYSMCHFYLYPNNLLFQPKETFRVEQQTDLITKGQEWQIHPTPTRPEVVSPD